MNIFELLNERYTIPDKPKLFEAFSGVGCQMMAFKRLGIEVESVGFSEIDKYAIQSYQAIHGNHKSWGSIVDIKGKDLPEIDVFTYSFPCFTKDALIMTNIGFKKIVDVMVGDMVMTHDKTFKRVIRTLDNGVKQTLEIKGMSVDEIVCTQNHKFYVRELKRVYHHKPNTQSRRFETPKWVEAKDLNKNTYLSIAINQNSIIPTLPKEIGHLSNEKDFWYIVGRYLGDGWLRHQSGIIICCERSETNEISDRLDRLGINYCVSEERTVNKLHISKQVYKEYFAQFGKGASNKRITSDVFNLPIDLLEGFVEGYLESDGSYTQGVYKTSSVSKELSYGFAQCVAKVYKTPYRIYKNIRKKDYLIEGRSGKQLPAYSVVFKKEVRKQDKAFFEDGYIWFPIKSIKDRDLENVYDLEVEDNHSYTVNGTIVHNCTDLSKAGKQKGLSNTRSGLVYEVLRILNELKEEDRLPKVLIMENVVDLVQVKFIKQFQEIQLELEELGYSNYTETLNAKDYGVAQNRDRVFMVSILGDYYYEFPKPIKLEKRLRDYLETNVDKKYRLSDRMLQGMMKTNFNSYQLENRLQDLDGCISTILTRYEGSPQVVDHTKINVIGNYMPSNHDASRIVHSDGLAPAVKENHGTITATNEPCLIIPENTEKGFAIAQEGDGVYTNRPHQKRGVVQKGMIQTIKANNSDIGVVVSDLKREYCNRLLEEGLVEPYDMIRHSYTNNRLENDMERKEGQNDISAALTTRPDTLGVVVPEVKDLIIRKLTPLEVWRLMGIDDEDFHKAQKSGVPSSQLYKQAGNGLVVDVFALIISTMVKR